MSKMIKKKRLEKYEQLIENAISSEHSVNVLLGSKNATEALMSNISNIKANLIDYSRVYTKFMREICETEDMDDRKEMLASAECAFGNMMACVSQTMGIAAVLSMQEAVFEGVDKIFNNYRNDYRITAAQCTLDALMLEILKATALTGNEGTIINTRLKAVHDKAMEAIDVYPFVFSLLKLFDKDSSISPKVATTKEFSEIRDALMSDTRVDESTIDELIHRLHNDTEAYKDARHLSSYFDV